MGFQGEDRGPAVAMSQLENALRYYDRIALPGQWCNESQSDALEAWLTGAVVPLVDELMELDRFHQLANWPIEVLSDGAETPSTAKC